nr:hypothetical protein [Tanacetum cinerariifolium]
MVASDSGSPSQPPQAHPGAAFPRLLLQPRKSVSCRDHQLEVETGIAYRCPYLGGDMDTFIADVISSASSKFVAAFAERREEKISVGLLMF